MTSRLRRTRIGAWCRQAVVERLSAAVGGGSRLRVVVLLAGVLGLAVADSATVGAVAAELEDARGGQPCDRATGDDVGRCGGNRDAALRALTDRVDRTRLLSVVILLWCVAMVACGAALSYPMLPSCRIKRSVVAVMKARDSVAVAAIRSALGALDNAEAVDATQAPQPSAGHPQLAGTVHGLRAAEVERRSLSAMEMEGLLRAEVADRHAAASEYERAGHQTRAERLRREAAALRMPWRLRSATMR